MTERSGSEVDPDLLAADLATRYLPRLRVFAARRLRDTTAAEDAAQETLRRVLEALRQGRVRDLQALPCYTFETARHVCQHFRRDSQRNDIGHGDLRQQAAASGRPQDPLAALVSAERVRDVRRAIGTLDPADRELIKLSFVDGYSAEVIGERLGLTAVNVRVRRHRILRRLGALLTVTPHAHAEPVE